MDVGGGRRRICTVRRDFSSVGFAKRWGCCGAGLSRERALGNGTPGAVRDEVAERGMGRWEVRVGRPFTCSFERGKLSTR
jgi:hypothetical protein